MTFRYPRNFNFRPKLFGFIDYYSLIFFIIWFIFIFSLLHLFYFSLKIRLLIYIVTCIPIFFISIAGFNHENSLFALLYIIKYLTSTKLYLYSKKD